MRGEGVTLHAETGGFGTGLASRGITRVFIRTCGWLPLAPANVTRHAGLDRDSLYNTVVCHPTAINTPNIPPFPTFTPHHSTHTLLYIPIMLFPCTLAVVATLLSLVAAQKSVFSTAAEWIDGTTQYRPSPGHDLSSEVPFQALFFPVLKYTVVEGFFKQSDERTDDRTYDAVSVTLASGLCRRLTPCKAGRLVRTASLR